MVLVLIARCWARWIFRAVRWRRSPAASAPSRHRTALIVGDAGTIETTFYNDTSDPLPPTLVIRRGIALDAPRETIVCDAAAGFRALGRGLPRSAAPWLVAMAGRHARRDARHHAGD